MKRKTQINATSFKISHTKLQSKRIECSLAREKLAMSNARLVMSIAQKYDNMGTEMADLVRSECLNISTRKVRNATEAINKVFSLDREAFPSLNGLQGETLHSYIADNRLENNPWHGVDEWSTLQEEVDNLIRTTLGTREQDIIRLYYGLDKGLGYQEKGLVAMEKLKHAARKRRLEAMLVKH